MGGACRDTDTSKLEGVGTLEVVEHDVAPLAAGRVARVWRDEGDLVRQGDTLVTLTQAALPADIAGRRARVDAAEAQLRDLQAGARPAERERAAADLRAAEAEAERLARDVARLTPLAERATISRQQLDAARTAAATAAARRDALRQTLRLVREGTRPERVAAARAEVAAARAALAGAEGVASDLVLVAPVAGAVVGRHVERGEALPSGVPAVTVGDPTRPYVRIYVGQEALPRVRIGARAVGRLDAFPDRAFAGRVTAIATRAEFTPRVALTKEERADLLFAVKVEFRDASGMLKAGLPITVRLDAAPALGADTPTTARADPR